MASHASLAQEHCQAWDDAVQLILLSLQKTIRSVPPSPGFGGCVRALALQSPYLGLSLTQMMTLVPVPSPTSQPVGCPGQRCSTGRPQPASLWAVSWSKMQYRSVMSDSCLQGKTLVSWGQYCSECTAWAELPTSPPS